MVPRENAGTPGPWAARFPPTLDLHMGETFQPRPATLADPRLDGVPFVAFDTETTGLRLSDRLVEIAAVRFRGGEVEAEWSTLVDPGVPLPEAATRIHGIRDEDLHGQPRPAQALGRFLELIEGAALVAHHAPFDVRVVASELLQAGLPLPDNPVLDTCAIPRALGLPVENHRLTTLARAFGLRQGLAHRALPDARTAAGLLRAYLEQVGPRASRLVREGLTGCGAGLASFRAWACEPVPETPIVRVLRRARAEGRAVSLVYRGGTRGLRPRWAVPRELYAIGGVVYLEADCLEVGAPRTFRLDRIAAVRVDEVREF